MKTKLTQAIESYQDEMLEFIKKLISIPTENPPGNSYGKCIDVISEKLDEIGLAYNKIEIPTDDKVNPNYALQSFFGTGKETLHFHGHYDVVPASDPSQFEPYIEKGNLFGRGSSDMKSGLAVMIYAVKALKDCNVELNGKVGLTFVPDEETGGKFGSQYLAQSGYLGKDGIGLLTPEPSSGIIWNANRGAISMKVTIKGKPAHVGLHYKGINAFEQMIEVVNSLMELKKEVGKRKTNFNIQPEMSRSSIFLLGGETRGGTNFNVVPEECSFTIDRRINPEEILDTEKKQILEILEMHKNNGINIEVDIFQEGDSTGISEDVPLAKSLVACITEVKKKTPVLELCPGLLENRFYAKLGMPTFAYGPGLLSVSHGPNEFIKIKDIFTFTAIYALLAVRTFTE